MSEVGEAKPRPRRNWWKAGFFVALVGFEIAREVAVIEADQKAEPNASKSIFSTGDYTVATGSWIRSDGGSPIVPGLVKIECRKELGQCVEASVSAHDQYFFAPELDWFDATFTPEGVTYVNDMPDCARYAVRIDTVTKRAFATRDRKPNPANEMCAKMEKRVAMELGDGSPRIHNAADEHFVPLIQLIGWLFGLFM